MLVFVRGILHTFGNNNSNRCMWCSSIGIGVGNIIWVWLRYLKVLVTGMLFDFAIIIETIIVVAEVLGYGFVLRILYDFILVFWYMLGNMWSIKNRYSDVAWAWSLTFVFQYNL